MADDEEQIIGVLKRCTVCDDKTLHVDGVCQEHKVIRRKKRKARAVPPPPPPPPPPPKKRKYAGRVISLLVIGGLVYLFGAVHIVHGDRTGLRACWKDGWRLTNTLVDSDEKSTDRGVIAALAKCGL